MPSVCTCDTYEIDQTQALWYAWGREDASGTVTQHDGDRFAVAYANHAQAFRDGRISFRLAIRNAYDAWQRGDVIPGSEGE